MQVEGPFDLAYAQSLQAVATTNYNLIENIVLFTCVIHAINARRLYNHQNLAVSLIYRGNSTLFPCFRGINLTSSSYDI